MKVYVAGNCQAQSLFACLEIILTGIPVELCARNAVLEADEGDIIFRQRTHGERVSPPGSGREIQYPRFWFSAFHPDLALLAGPMGPIPLHAGLMHSSLIVYAWHRDMSVSDTLRLFSEPVFERLGYFDRWDSAVNVLLEECNGIGFPIESTLRELEGSGCFMHMPPHPALIVMAHVARTLVELAGLVPAFSFPEQYLIDPAIMGPSWPVYPEIAARLGVHGEYGFKGAQLPDGTPPVVRSLPEFIATSFKAFSAMTPGSLSCKRLESSLYRDLESVVAGERRGASTDRESGDGYDSGIRDAAEFSAAHERSDAAAAGATPRRVMEQLEAGSMRVRLSAQITSRMRARTTSAFSFCVENRGDESLSSDAPYPVFLAYRWFDVNGAVVEVGKSLHTRLSGVLEPGASLDGWMAIAAPGIPGTYRLKASLLQSTVAWFDDVDPANGFTVSVDVEAV